MTLRPAVLLLMVIAAAGASAAIRVSPILWIVTAIVFAAVYAGWRRSLSPAGQERYTVFPEQLRERVELTLAQLPRGEARQLLSRILAHAVHVFEQPDQAFDSVENESVRQNVEELVDACLTAALELARLDEVSPKNSTRAVFVGKLGDAANALGALYESGVRGGTPASHRVSELTAEIQADASARTKAKEDMGRLLG